MGRAKEIIVKVIPAKIANEFVKKHHYSGKIVNNSSVHFGCFLDGRLHGVLSYGNPTDKSKVLHLVKPTAWNEMLELNRMAFDSFLPKNSESRCIAITIKAIKKKAPHIKWILSFSDACQCGDGAIYRASGFVLTNIKKNNRLIRFKDGYITHALNLCHRGSPIISKKYNPENLTENKLYKRGDFEYIKGFQLRYIYLIDKSSEITVPIIPFSRIEELGAGMYKGEKITRQKHKSNAASHQEEQGGAVPTLTLH